MRSKLGTRARLAAHIMALVLLILMLVYLDSPKQQGLDWRSLGAIRPAEGGVMTPGDQAATLDRLAGRGRAGPVPEENLRPPAKSAAPAAVAQEASAPAATAPAPIPESVPESVPEPVPEPEPIPVPEAAVVPEPMPEPAEPTPVPEPEAEPAPEPSPEAEIAPVPEATAAPAAKPEPAPIQEPAPQPVAEPAPAPAPQPETTPVAAPPADPAPQPVVEPATEPAPEPASTPASAPETPAPASPQPDESGAIVIAAPSAAGAGGGAAQAATPLANANLEVLGDGVYWLAPGRDLEQELSAVPKLASLILLTPLPGYKAEGFAHVRTTAIPADTTDLSADAAEHFLHLVRTGPRPVVAAVLPGARGSAYFKGAYLILERGMTAEEARTELEAELADAGGDKDEIAHRLSSLASRPPL